jgi:hypothetical protein
MCLWLKEASPADLKALPEVMERVRKVAEIRAKSPTKSVREFARFPTLFTQDRQPPGDYLMLPRHSSERRRFIPIAFFSNTVIASDASLVCLDAKKYHFGIICSSMHNAWVRYVCGRLESRYRYEPSVYNNFPWPDPSDKQRETIETARKASSTPAHSFPTPRWPIFTTR